MTIVFQQTNRAKIILIAYVVLIWFLLVLGGSLLGTFARSPLVFYLTVGAPVVLFLAGYLLSEVFRGFVRSLVGDPWVITALQTYRVLGVSMAIEALRNALPAVFGLPAGFGDFFIGVRYSGVSDLVVELERCKHRLEVGVVGMDEVGDKGSIANLLVGTIHNHRLAISWTPIDQFACLIRAAGDQAYHVSLRPDHATNRYL